MEKQERRNNPMATRAMNKTVQIELKNIYIIYILQI